MSKYITSICKYEESCPRLILLLKLYLVYPSTRKDYPKYIPCQVQGYTMLKHIQVFSFQGYLWYICAISPYVPVLGTGYLWYIFGISGISNVYTNHHLKYLWLIQGYPYS